MFENEISTIKEILCELDAFNKNEDEVRLQTIHLQNILFILMNYEQILSDRSKLFSEKEAQNNGNMIELKYATGLLMHFEHVDASEMLKKSELNEQIDVLMTSYKLAKEKKCLAGFFANLGFGACLQAKTEKLRQFKQKLQQNNFLLDDLMHQWLWQYEVPEDEPKTIERILDNHLNTHYFEKDGKPKILTYETVKEFLINVNYYDQSSFSEFEKRQVNASNTKKQNQSSGFFRTHWKKVLIGAAVGVAVTGALVAAGFITGGIAPIIFTAVAAAHITVSHTVALGVGITAATVASSSSGAAVGALIGKTSDYLSGSTKSIYKSIKVDKNTAPIPYKNDKPDISNTTSVNEPSQQTSDHSPLPTFKK